MASKSHIVLVGPFMWGHLRGLCVLAAKIVAERDVVVTLLIQNLFQSFTMGSAEAMRGLADIPNPKGDLRVLAFGEPFALDDRARMYGAEKNAFDLVWRALVNQEPVKCSATGKEFARTVKPTVVVVDGMHHALLPTIRTAIPAIPVLRWLPPAAAYFAAFGFFSAGAPTILNAVLPDYTPEERVNGRAIPISGHVVDVPGLPRMYDWENFPYEYPFMGIGKTLSYLYNLAFKNMYECDGLITLCAPAHDGAELILEFDKWAANRGVPIFHMGPMRLFRPGTTEFGEESRRAELAASGPGVGDLVSSFLDRALSTKGECSVIYVNFGSAVWPVSNSGHVWAVIEAFGDRGIPFIISHPSPMAQVPDDIASRFGPGGSQLDQGLVLPWVPQQTILAHKAVGWFLSHGGAGGCMDALTQGVPLIGWPLMGDAPANIKYLTHQADVAFELIEGRTGELGLKPLLMAGKSPTGTLEAFKEEINQVLDHAAGEVGARKRANAKRMQVELAKAWAEGGSARRAFDAFVAKYHL